MKVFDLISGAGGGKGGNDSRVPINEADNLNSVATGKLLDVLSEGEIAGFATPFENNISTSASNYQTECQKNIFLNKTPILKATANSSSTTASDYNFNTTNLQTETNEGTPNQSSINGFSKIRSNISAFPSDDLTDANAEKVKTINDSNLARAEEIVVIVGISSLFQTNNKGDVRGGKLRFQLFRSIDGSTNVEVANVLVDGRTNDLYQIQKTIPIPIATNTNARTITITLRKVNAAPSEGDLISVGNSCRFMSLIKIINQNKSYPNTALVGIKIDAENFSSIPKRSYLLKGIKIRIPHGTQVNKITGRIEYPTNYVFNGSMQNAQFCACPVFVLYDILTSQRYGFGDQILKPFEKSVFNGSAQNIDLYSFVEASKYANTLVSDRRTNPTSQTGTYSQTGSKIIITFTANSKLQNGDVISCDFTSGNASDLQNVIISNVRTNKTIFDVQASNSTTTSGDVTITKGNTEARYAFNGVINKQEDAFKLLNKVASVFRGSVYFSEGKIKLTCDKPADPVYLFGTSNVTEEGFSYEGSDIKTRANCIVVRFFNNVSQQIDYVQHPLASDLSTDTFVTKYGLNKKQIDAFGTTSAGQASRLARFIYYSENFLTETCSFTTTADAGVILKPGMVISVSDPVKSGIRLAGRIRGQLTTTTQINIDNPLGFTATSGDKISVVMPDGTMETRNVISINNLLVFALPPFSEIPNENSVWLYEKTTAEPTTWRVLSIKQSENLQYTITALSYNGSLYNTIEGGTDVEAKDITTLNELIDAPSNLTIRESLYKHVPNANVFATNNGNIRVQLRLTWPSVLGAVKYKVVYQKGTLNSDTSGAFNSDENDYDNPVDIIVNRNEFELRNVESGYLYKFSVKSMNGGGLLSTVPIVTTHTVVGKSAPPSDVANLTATLDPNDGLNLNWIPVTPVQPNFADLDLAGYEIKKGTVWANGTHPETGSSTSGIKVQSTNLFLPLEFIKTSSSYMVKAFDTSGNFSTNATSVVATITNPTAIQNIIKSQENGILKINFDAPNTSTYAIKNYKITYNDVSAKTVFIDTNEFLTPLSFAGSSRTFTIAAVDLAGNLGTSTDVVVSPQLPNAPVNLVHSFTTDSVLLKWTEASSAGNLQPPVIGYEIRRDGVLSARVKSTELLIPINVSNFPNVSGTLKATYTVAALYLDPSKPTEGKASTNIATITDLTITQAPAPTITAVFDLDNVVLSWTAVNGSIPTKNYGIFDNSNTLIETTDTTTFRTLANYSSKVFKIKAFSAAYHNEANVNKGFFEGTVGTFTSTRTNLSAPTNGSYALGSNGGLGFVTLSWSEPTIDFNNNLGFKSYKILRSSSSTFAGVNANNTELTAILDSESFKEEVSWTIQGTNTQIEKYYYVLPIDLLGNEGNALKIEVIIKRPGTVQEGGINEVIDNNVLLRWAAPSVDATDQLKIDHYIIKKNTGNNSNYNSSTLIGEINGLFNVVFETVPNTYTYLIKAVDMAGNESLNPLATLLVVAQPPDFVLNANHNSTFDTTPSQVTSVSLTNCLKIFDFELNKDVLYMPVLADSSGVGTETWQQHFVNNSKTNLQGFISASNLNYLEPAPTGDSNKGVYEELYDYGTSLTSTKVSTLAQVQSEGTGTVTRKHKLQLATASGSFDNGVEEDGDSVSRFGSGFQRVKYTIEAVSSSTSSPSGSLIKINTLNLRIDAKIKNDTGVGTANASDTNGTVVNLNTSFVDIQGVNVTPNVYNATAQAIIAVVDFQDIPNPTSFKVLLYNSSGTRISGNFTWQCRGT